MQIRFLSAGEQKDFLDIAYPVRYPKGKTIYHQGDDSDNLAIIESGQVRVFRYTVLDRPTDLAIFGAGEVIGEVACLADIPHYASVEAETAVTLRTARRSAVLDLFKNKQQIHMKFTRLLCDRVITAYDQVCAFDGLSMSAKLATALLFLADRCGQDMRYGNILFGVRIKLRLTQARLGRYAGMAQGNVCHMLNKWEAAGWVLRDGDRCIIVRDKEALRKIRDGEQFG